MSRLLRISCAIVLTLGLALFLTPSNAGAQERVSFDGQGGIAVPAGELANLTGVGPTLGLRAAYSLNRALSVNLFGDLDLLSGDRLSSGVTAPDLRLWHYGLDVEARLLPESMRRWSLGASLGFGATTYSSDEFGPANGRDSYSHTYFTTSGGVRLRYSMNSRINTFIAGRAHWMATDKDDTAALAALDPETVKSFSSAWTFPLTAGFNVRI